MAVGPRKDYTGLTFGVLYCEGFDGWYVSPSGVKQARWRTRCTLCGKEMVQANARLKKGVCSCQTVHKKGYKVKDLTGQRFGRLTVIRLSSDQSGSSRSARWICQCECGNIITVQSNKLKDGSVRSCGCFKREVAAEKLRRGNEPEYVEDTRLASLTQKVRKQSTTGIKGVVWDPDRGKYMAYIGFQHKRRFLGRYDSLEEAARAREEAEQKYYDPMLAQHGRTRNKEK